MPIGLIESLDHDARGVTRQEGKTIFVEGALPGETVEYQSFRTKPTYEVAQVSRVIKASVSRVQPRCPHFDLCGGCSMQHLDPTAQVAVKQRVLEDNLWHIGRIKPEQYYSPIFGQPWGYRHRARLSVRMVQRKNGVLVGFHEKKSSFIADLGSCAILPPHVSALIMPLRELFTGLSIRDRMPQVEVAVGAQCTVLDLRILDPLTELDEEKLRAFVDRHGVVLFSHVREAMLREQDPIRRIYIGVREHLAYAEKHRGIFRLVFEAMPMRYRLFRKNFTGETKQQEEAYCAMEREAIIEAQKQGIIRTDA